MLQQAQGTPANPGARDREKTKVAESSAMTTEVSDTQVPDVLLDAIPQVELYPVRYAVALNRKGVPKVDGTQFKAADADGAVFPLGKEAVYTTRCLRKGYLYVYDETDSGWRIFAVESIAPRLKLIDVVGVPKNASKQSGDSSPHSPGRETKRLDLLQQPTSGGFIRVPAGHVVWLGFSDARWTSKTLQEHQAPSVRAAHMRRFDSGAWKDCEHTAPLAEAGKRVADHVGVFDKGTLTPRLPQDLFEFSQEPFEQVGEIALPSDPEEGEFAMVALDDPAGIAMDLARLMSWHFLQWSAKDDPNYVHFQGGEPSGSPMVRHGLVQGTPSQSSDSKIGKRALPAPPPQSSDSRLGTTGPSKRSFQWTMASSHGIQSLMGMDIARAEASVWNRHRVSSGIAAPATQMTDKQRRDSEEIWDMYLQRACNEKSAGSRGKLLKIVEHKVKSRLGSNDDPASLSKVTKADEIAYDIAKARRKAIADWETNHRDDYDMGAHATWAGKLGEELGKLDTQYIQDLAKAHVRWCESQRMVAYFKHVFDRTYQGNDCGIGLAYTDTLARCYEGVQDKVHCFDHILKWLESPVSDDNLIVPAIVLNHGATREEINSLHGASVESNDSAWDQVASAFLGAYGTGETALEAAEARPPAMPSAPVSPPSKPASPRSSPLPADVARQVILRRGQRLAADASLARYMATISQPLRKSLDTIAQTGTMKAGAASVHVVTRIRPTILSYTLEPGPVATAVPITSLLKRRVVYSPPGGIPGVSVPTVKVSVPTGAAKPATRVQVRLMLGLDMRQTVRQVRQLPSGELEVLSRERRIIVPAEQAAAEIADSLSLESRAIGRVTFDEGTLSKGSVRIAAPSEGFGLCTSLFGGLLASVARTKIAEQCLKAENVAVKADLEARKWAYLGIEVSAYTETLSKVLGQAHMFKGMAAKGVQICGALGVAGGFYLAYRDYLKAQEALKRGEHSLSAAYYLASISGVAISAIALTAMIPSLLASTSALLCFLGGRLSIAIGIQLGAKLMLASGIIAESALFAWIPIIGWGLAITGILVSIYVAGKERKEKILTALQNCCWGSMGRFASLKIENDSFQAAVS